MTRTLENIFPTPIQLSSRITIDDEPSQATVLDEQSVIEATAKSVHENQGGNATSVDRNILDELPELRKFIQRELDEYWKDTVTRSGKAVAKITQSWINFTPTGTHHHQHYHSNSIVSGVYYFMATPTDTISFGRPGQPQILLPQNALSTYTSPAVTYNVQPGGLILFPSHLTHWVNTVEQENHVRISLSFNTWVTGQLGEEHTMNRVSL